MDNTTDQARKIVELTQGNICNRCLGRTFYPHLPGKNNDDRGSYLQELLRKENSTPDKTESCHLCGDVFLNLDNTLEKIISIIEKSQVEFSTFLVGCRLPPEIMEKEKELQEITGCTSDSLKKEINRELGKKLELRLNREVDFNNPNLVIMVDFTRNWVDLQINPLFIEGRYRKLLRGIPQTRWPCRKCRGKGCESCNYTGKMYPESVEELIA